MNTAVAVNTHTLVGNASDNRNEQERGTEMYREQNVN